MKRHHWRKKLRLQRLDTCYSWLFCGILGIGLALYVIAHIERELTPVLESMATARVHTVVSQALNQTITQKIAETSLSYADMITMEKDTAGQITALTSNMAALNQLRTSLSTAAVAAVSTLDTGALAIPIGNLTGINLFSGRGSTVPVEVVCVGTCDVTFENQFSEAGINQTQHQIIISSHVNVDILLPGETLHTYISVQVPAAETIIVGSVPDTYLSMEYP